MKVEGGSVTGKLAAGAAAVGAGAVALSGKGSGSADVKVGFSTPQDVPARLRASTCQRESLCTCAHTRPTGGVTTGALF